MNITNRWTSATSGRHLLHRVQNILFAIGGIAVFYAALTILYAQIYQKVADVSISRQIYAEEQPGAKSSRTAVKEGDVLGRIEIPKLGLTAVVLEGTTSRTLRRGIGHIEGTALPGELGNIGIAGHRDTFFRRLKDLRAGDMIQLQTAAGISRYTVDWIQITAPRDAAILSSSTGPAITLITCYPFHFIGPAPERFAVHARRN